MPSGSLSTGPHWLDPLQGPFEHLPKIESPEVLLKLETYYRVRSSGLTGYDLRRFAASFDKLWRCAQVVVRIIETEQGARFRLSSRVLAEEVGVSQSTASRCLKTLRHLGLIALWRRHHVNFVKRLGGWVGVAAVYQVLTHPFGLRWKSMSQDSVPAETLPPPPD